MRTREVLESALVDKEERRWSVQKGDWTVSQDFDAVHWLHFRIFLWCQISHISMHAINCIFALWQLPFQRSKINQRRWETECWIPEYQIELPKSKLTHLWWEQICSIVMEMKIVSRGDKINWRDQRKRSQKQFYDWLKFPDFQREQNEREGQGDQPAEGLSEEARTWGEKLSTINSLFTTHQAFKLFERF